MHLKLSFFNVKYIGIFISLPRKFLIFTTRQLPWLFRNTTNADTPGDTFGITYRFKCRLTDDTSLHSSTCRFWNTLLRPFVFILVRDCLNHDYEYFKPYCLDEKNVFSLNHTTTACVQYNSFQFNEYRQKDSVICLIIKRVCVADFGSFN